ncbi:MAG: hypothetical protein RLZZ522_400 [Verrucomicrobiota bacterium]
MKSPFCRVALVTLALGGGSALAELPSLGVRPWMGYFLGTKTRDFSFGLTSQGAGVIIPMGKGDKEVAMKLRVPVTFLIEEVLPDGRTIVKKILPETLESNDSATAKPSKTRIRGKVTGGASFEAFFEVERGIIAIGGRLLEPGTLTKNPLRFGVRATFPESYPSTKESTKEAAKALTKKLEGDRYGVLWTDGKRAKFNGADKIKADPKKGNGPGIARLEVEVAAYQGKAFEFTASAQSNITLSTRLAQPLGKGLVVNWYPDPAADPEAKARLKFTVK